VGIFLALLELLRHYKFRAEQPQGYHEIWILPPLPGVLEEAAAQQASVLPTDGSSLAAGSSEIAPGVALDEEGSQTTS
jgi:hypothetical protein